MVWVHVFMLILPASTISTHAKASIDAELQGQQKKRKKRWVDPTWVAQVWAREMDLFFREEMPPFWANSSHFDPKKYRPFTFINIQFVHNLFQQRLLQEIARNILTKKQDILRSTASMHHHPFFFVAPFCTWQCHTISFSGIFWGIFSFTQLPGSIDFIYIFLVMPHRGCWCNSATNPGDLQITGRVNVANQFLSLLQRCSECFFVLHHLTVCKNRTPYRNWERNALMFSRWSMTYIYIYVCDIRVGVFVFGCLCGTSCCILHQIFRCLSECSSYKPRF